MGATAAILAVSVGTAVYSASQKPKQPTPPKAVEVPKLPNSPTLAQSNQQADLAARTAGGTILNKRQGEFQVGDGANGVRKTLLGQ